MKIKILTWDLDGFEEQLQTLIDVGWEPKFESYNCFEADIGYNSISKASIILVKMGKIK